MAPHSSTFAWKIPWTEGPGGLQSMGSLELDTTEQLHFHFSLSCIGEGNGTPLQCSCLENPKDGGSWWAAVYGVTQSRTWLKRLSSSSSSRSMVLYCLSEIFLLIYTSINSIVRAYPSYHILASDYHPKNFLGYFASPNWNFYYYYLQIKKSVFVVTCSMQDLSSLTRDWTQAPWTGNMESQPLDSQGSSPNKTFI